MSDIYEGGCACGRVRYHIADAPVFSNHCQCTDCRQRSGTGHGSYLTFANRAKVTLKGEAAEWQSRGDSGNMKSSGFCPACGTPVYLTFAAMPNLFTVTAASLDDPTRFKPQVVTYHARALAWDRIDPALQMFETMPG